MFHLIRSELLKMRHTFALKLFIAAPVVTLGLGYFLSGIFWTHNHRYYNYLNYMTKCADMPK